MYVSNRKIIAIMTRHDVDGAIQVTQQVSHIVCRMKNYKEISTRIWKNLKMILCARGDLSTEWGQPPCSCNQWPAHPVTSTCSENATYEHNKDCESYKNPSENMNKEK